MPEDIPPVAGSVEALPSPTPLEDFFAMQIAMKAIMHDAIVSAQTEPLIIDTQSVTIEAQNVADILADLRAGLVQLMVQHKLRFPVTVRMQNTLLGQQHEFSVQGFAGIPAPELPDAVPFVPAAEE